MLSPGENCKRSTWFCHADRGSLTLCGRHYLEKELPDLTTARTIFEVGLRKPRPMRIGRTKGVNCRCWPQDCRLPLQADGSLLHAQVGCGVGNSVFPLLEVCSREAFIYACDFSDTAVDLVRCPAPGSCLLHTDWRAMLCVWP